MKNVGFPYPHQRFLVNGFKLFQIFFAFLDLFSEFKNVYFFTIVEVADFEDSINVAGMLS